MTTSNMRQSNKSLKAARVAGVTAVGAAAAFVPGQAEAHCGHGMYGIVHWTGGSNYEYLGCIGKGAQPMPSYQCVAYSGPSCTEWYQYYNCYCPA
jgi:hypothetical protein